MGDKSPKAKRREQKQKDVAKQAAAAAKMKATEMPGAVTAKGKR